MAMINIPSTCNDPQYRYKMPRLVSKKECRGKGSKTCIVNMGEVARALKRPPQYITKWFGIELCAQSTYTCKEGEGERAIVNGHHDPHVFQTFLDKFIDKYVLCSNCHLPEIDMYVKRKMIVAKCMACGWAGDLDNAHKLAAFITKNPPDDTGLNIVNQAEAGGGKLDKKARREVKAKLKEGKKDKESDEEEEEEDDDDASEKAKKHEKKGKKEKTEKKLTKEKKEKKEKKKKYEDEDEDKDEDGEKKEKKETKEKKEKKEMKEMKEMKEKKKEKDSGSDEESDDSRKKRGGDDDMEFDDEDLKDVVNNMRVLLEDKKANPSQFFEELRMHQIASCFDNKTRLYVALESLCGSALDSKAINVKSKYISLVISNGKMDAADVLCSFGMFIHMNKAAAKSYAMVLKAIYDADWAEEKDILNYYNEDEGERDPGFDAAKDGAGPFLKWLETAESDNDEEEEEEEEDKDEDSDED